MSDVDALLKIEDMEFTFVGYRSVEDNAIVIHVDTPSELIENQDGPMLRIYLNDGDAIWDNTGKKS